MNQDTIEYLNSWRLRIASIKGTDLHSLFDRFTTYYTLYNRFYNDTFRILHNSGLLTKPRYSDFERATSLVVLYNSAESIIEQLKSHNNMLDIERIAKLLGDDIFSINLADGMPQRELDMKLMKNLLSDDLQIKAQAVVSVIYNVRNNMLHGEKHFEPHQSLLLDPLIRIIHTIVKMQEEKLG